MRNAAVLAILVAAPGLLAALSGAFDLNWAVLGGLLVLACMFGRPAECALPSLLCLAGMALGLLVDGREIAPAMLAGLCGVGGAAQGAVDHWLILPATNGLMLTGALMAVAFSPARMPLRELACLPVMLVTMLAACHLGPTVADLVGRAWGPAALLTVMTVGMLWGEAVVDWVAVALARHRAVSPAAAR